MTETPGPEIIGIPKRNSLDFVRKVFTSYRSGALIALLDEGQEPPEVPGFRAGEITEPEDGGGWFSERLEAPSTNEAAQVVFTSGTEGKPKAILLSYRALADVVDRLNAAMEVDDSIREYVGVPVTYSFGLGRCRAVASAGGSFYLPEKGFDPLEIRRMLEAGEINAISAVPTLLRILLKEPEVLGALGARVKWVEIGSQYMSREEKEGLKRLFPKAVILQHYGLTEASRSTFLLVNEVSGEALESVGRPFGEVEVRTAADGRILIRGPHVAIGRVENGEIVPLADEEGWLATSDQGSLLGPNLHFEGRADDLINSGGIKIDPAHLEQQVARKFDAGIAFAIARIADADRGDGFFVGAAGASEPTLKRIENAVHEVLKQHGVSAGSSVKVQAVDEIPATGTGKVRRNELARKYRPAKEPARPGMEAGAGVLALYRDMFGRNDIPRSASFQDLGGDSLNYVEMAIALEKRLGQLPLNWDNLPVSELVALEGAECRQKPGKIETSIVLRALAITCVVAAHSGLLMFGGGTFLLFFLIGHNLARFKSATLLSGDFVPALLKYTKTLLIPYFLLAALYMASQGRFLLDLVLFYTNVTELRLTQIFPFWFVQVLVQCLTITGLIFLIPAVRDFAKKNPWPFAFGMTAIFVAIWTVFPIVWNTEHLRNLVPQRYIALLWLGWCCYFANMPGRRLMALALGLAFAFIDSGISRNAAWISLGVVATLYVPMIRVPSMLRGGIQIVSAATFYIFALNGIIAWILGAIFERVFGMEPSVLIFLMTFAACLIGYWVIERALELIGEFRARFQSPTLAAKG